MYFEHFSALKENIAKAAKPNPNMLSQGANLAHLFADFTIDSKSAFSPY